jgi:sugar/nucleoside kinase (ribokinase family)
MNSIDLVCVGESFEDLIFASLTRLPRLGEEVRAKSFVRTFGGGATITAVASARLGLSTGIVSALSTGAVAWLRGEGVRITNLRKPDEPHAITAALSTATDRAFATFDGVNAILAPRIISSLARVRSRLVHCAMCPRDIPPLLAAIRALRARGVVLSFDPGYHRDLANDPRLPDLIAEVDYLLINENEAKLYSKRRTIAQAEDFFRGRVANTIIKRGAAGSRWLRAHWAVEERAPRVRAIDTTGAGDAFNAGLIAGVLNGFSARRSLRLGNVVGARSTAAVGGLDALPRLEDL